MMTVCMASLWRGGLTWVKPLLYGLWRGGAMERGGVSLLLFLTRVRI